MVEQYPKDRSTGRLIRGDPRDPYPYQMPKWAPLLPEQEQRYGRIIQSGGGVLDDLTEAIFSEVTTYIDSHDLTPLPKAEILDLARTAVRQQVVKHAMEDLSPATFAKGLLGNRCTCASST